MLWTNTRQNYGGGGRAPEFGPDHRPKRLHESHSTGRQQVSEGAEAVADAHASSEDSKQWLTPRVVRLIESASLKHRGGHRVVTKVESVAHEEEGFCQTEQL